ncbi:hypothetical protein PybrP1_008817 [[Pythium] brassicae (nom. inval.)]|nr:hypothetical protein PybrP1_008817 [[Pythium] brassicae (nom. inval.)]
MDLHFQRSTTKNDTSSSTSRSTSSGTSGSARPRTNDRDARMQRWMEQRAAAGDFLSIVRSVAECYTPLFREHPALAGSACALAELVAQRSSSSSSDDPPPAHAAAEQPQPQQFREGRTKQLEQLALDVLFKSSQPELAVAVYENRQAVAAALAHDDRAPRMDAHYRSFFSLACGAYAALARHEQVVQVYEAAAAAKLWPTVAMNVNYVRALTTLRRYEAVAAAYASISTADGVQNVFFYRCLLFYAGAAGDVAVQRSVRAAMRGLRFALRPVDVAHCIRAFDREYFAVGERGAALPVASYVELCAATATGGDAERLARAVDGARNVLALFNEFVASSAVDGVVVVSDDVGKTLYPRVLTAAVVAGCGGSDSRALERVRTVVQTRRARGNAPFGEDALLVAVTGLLLCGDPHDAWRLVLEELEHASLRPRALSAVASNVLAFLCAARSETATQLILRVLNDLARRRPPPAAGGVVANAQVRAVLDALCADTAAVPDEQQLLALVAAHHAVFRVRDQPFWFAYFLASCRAHGRLAAAKSAFHGRDAAAVPTIPAELALACIESYAARGDMEFVYRLAQAANAQRAKPREKRALGSWAVRACGAVDWLGADEIRAVAVSLLQDVPRSELPADVQALLAQVETGEAS